MSGLSLDDLLSLEQQGWHSLCDSRGDASYGSLMTTDALMILVNGMVMDRDAVVASLGQAPAWDGYRIHDERLVPMGSETAALIYRVTARRGAEPPFEALMASTYQFIDGEPRLKLYQQTTATHQTKS